MHFITATVIFGLVSATIAAPQPEIKNGPSAVGGFEGFFPGSAHSACYCCPAALAGQCSQANEDGRCVAADVLICCDSREQVSLILVSHY